MPAGSEKTSSSGWIARMRDRHADRKERRRWRRERRKGFVSAYDAHNEAESRNYQGGFFKKD